MVTALVYLFNAFILGFFALKVFNSIRKKPNPFLFYFFGVTTSFSLSLFVYAILITASILTDNSILLYWSDFLGRGLLYVGSAFAIQTPLYKFFPKSKYRFIASAIIAIFGVTLTVYNFVVPNYPFIDQLSIVHWQANSTLGLGLALIILGVWLPTSIVFILEFYKSKFTSKKSFFLGLGFLVGSIAGALQDFGKTTFEYVVINLLLAVGYFIIFIGLFYDEKDQ